MTQKDKQLLLIDLCTRLPYNVAIRCTGRDADYNCFLTTDILHEIQNGDEYYDYKPYLRPMSSMTEKEKVAMKSDLFSEFTAEGFDWLNAHHFDYRGLIPMGLALEAKEGMYKTE